MVTCEQLKSLIWTQLSYSIMSGGSFVSFIRPRHPGLPCHYLIERGRERVESPPCVVALKPAWTQLFCCNIDSRQYFLSFGLRSHCWSSVSVSSVKMELSTGDVAAVVIYFLLIIGVGFWVRNLSDKLELFGL